MFSKLGNFVAERAGSLVSKKAAAAVGAEVIISGAIPGFQGVPACVYIVSQAVLDGWKYYVAKRGS